MNEVARGPISDHVADNVKRLRDARRWSLAELSEQMGRVGRPMLPSGLHRLEQGNRRVDVDDLVALALALDVAPITLLLPRDTAEERVGLTRDLEADVYDAWAWIRAYQPLYAAKSDLPKSREEVAIRATTFLAESLPPGVRGGDVDYVYRAMRLLGDDDFSHEETHRLIAKLASTSTLWRRDVAGEEVAADGEHPEAP